VAAAQTGIRVHEDPQALTFRVSGRATMQQSPAVLRVANESLAAGVSTLRVDLRDCAYMDSTFLGSLLALKRAAGANGGADFALVAPSAVCRGLLRQMGMDRVLRIIEEPETGPADDGRELEVSSTERQTAFQETVVRAHQELAALPGSGADQFKSIASKLTKAWEAEKGRTPH
jgi:anti-anti-sigma factor